MTMHRPGDPQLDALAETEYAKSLDPRYAQPARFGTFLRDPRFPDRRDANQLLRVRCWANEHAELLDEIRSLYQALDLDFYKVSGHDPLTWQTLPGFLEKQGWMIHREARKIHTALADLPQVNDLAIRAADPSSADLEHLFTRDGSLDRGFEFGRSRYALLGGQYLIGYAFGEPVCTSGWYAVGHLVRFRYVYTVPPARGRGYASALIQHICDLPAVRAQRGTVIFVGEGGPDALYEKLGFRTRGSFFGAIGKAA